MSQKEDSSRTSKAVSKFWTMPDLRNSKVIATQKAEIDRLSGDVQRLELEKVNLISKHYKLQKNLEEQQKKTASLKDEVDALELKETKAKKDYRDEHRKSVSLQRQLDGFQGEERLDKERIDDLLKERSRKNQSLSERDNQAREFGAEADQQRTENEERGTEILQLKKDLSAMGAKRDTLKRMNDQLGSEAIQLRERLYSASACGSEEAKREAEAQQERVQTLTNKINGLQAEASQQKALGVEKEKEKDRQLAEVESLRTARGVQAVEKELRERELQDVKTQLAAQQASSAAREKGLRENQQQEAELLRQQHKDDLALRDRNHAAEKDQLQAQVETLLRNLSDDQREDRDIVRRAMEQLEKTSNATNYIMNAAYAAYQRSRQAQHRPAANIRPY